MSSADVASGHCWLIVSVRSELMMPGKSWFSVEGPKDHRFGGFPGEARLSL